MKTKDTKERILEAALKQFSAKGYIGSTTREIAKEAGISEVTLFRHFPTKEILLEATIRTHSFLPRIKNLLPSLSEMRYREALVSIGKAFMDRLNERKDLIRIMHSEFHLYPKEVREIQRNMLDEITITLASYFTLMQERGELRKFDPKIASKGFLGALFGFFTAREFQHSKDMRNIDVEVIINEYVEIFFRGTLK